MTVFYRFTRGRRSRPVLTTAGGDWGGDDGVPPNDGDGDGSGGEQRPPEPHRPLSSPNDWAAKNATGLFVHGFNDEAEARAQAGRLHDIETDDRRAPLQAELAELDAEAAEFEQREASLHQQRDALPSTVDDPAGGKEWTLTRVMVMLFLVSGLIGSLVGGLTYSYHQAELAGVVRGPAQAGLLTLCLVAVALFLHVITSQLPSKPMRVGAVIVQAGIGIVAAVLFWQGMAADAGGALPVDAPFDPTMLVAAPSGGSGSIAFYLVEAMATSLFLTLLVSYLADIGPRQLPNPDWVLLDEQHRELRERHQTLPARRRRVEDSLQALVTHRDACVDALVAAWRIKREAHTYRINTGL